MVDEYHGVECSDCILPEPYPCKALHFCLDNSITVAFVLALNVQNLDWENKVVALGLEM